MTEVIHIPGDSERVGRYSSEGALLWPKFDCDGNAINKKSASTRSLKDLAGNACFVVIAPNRDHDDLVFEVTAPPTEPAAPEVPVVTAEAPSAEEGEDNLASGNRRASKGKA